MFANAYRGRKVWLSGHTGFKGSWLAAWLVELGAEVHGFALPPATTPALFDQLGLEGAMRHDLADIRDFHALRRSLSTAQPDFIFHLAAQPLVRHSYEQPLATYATNVMGTAHVLEAARSLPRPCAVVCVTTDKCYENREWLHAYRESDPLGGHDPYSSSKAAAELAIASWRKSFFPTSHIVKIASARAGNVIGGGDWAPDRLVPDCVRALRQSEAIAVRNRTATRPWQHVLEPLSGYLWLGAVLAQPALRPFEPVLFRDAFNFGPENDSNRTVAEVVQEFLRHWPGRWEDRSDPQAVHEARLLHVSTDKAHHLLGWRPVWDFARTVAETARWYQADHAGTNDALARTCDQITAYQTDARARQVSWACA